MSVGNIQNTLMAFSMFDMWADAMEKSNRSHRAAKGSPLVDAAFKAFEGYVQTVETQNQALIAGVSSYVLTPDGKGAVGISQAGMAPLLALNLMA